MCYFENFGTEVYCIIPQLIGLMSIKNKVTSEGQDVSKSLNPTGPRIYCGIK